MPKENEIKIRKIGNGVRLMIWSNGRWYSMKLDSHKKMNTVNPLDRIKEVKLNKVTRSNYETIAGGIDADNAVSLSLRNMMSLCTTATNKEYFTLGMGLPGQMKVIVHLSRANAVDMKIAFKIADGDVTQQFVSSLAPKTLLLFCDGTYWHPIGEFTGSSDVGEWSMT